MQRLQAYKFELIVTGEQHRQMRRFSGACRFVYNKALALQKTRHEQGEKKLWGGALWSPSYFAGSCGGAPIEIIRQYIEQQQTPA